MAAKFAQGLEIAASAEALLDNASALNISMGVDAATEL